MNEFRLCILISLEADVGTPCLEVFEIRAAGNLNVSAVARHPDFDVICHCRAESEVACRKMKIEVDTQPPLEFDTAERLLLQPFSFMTRCLTLPNLFAGKMHALVFRTWKNRVKGRDWYDFEWYVRNCIPLNFNHLQVRIREFNGKEMGREQFAELLKEKLASADMAQVKNDVRPFLKNAHDIDIWSNDYFLQLADRIQYV